MSRSSNTARLARKIRDQTSLKLSTAFRLVQQANVYLGPFTGDSGNPNQRRLESHVAHVLASSFQDRQINGALLGVEQAQSDGQSLRLTLEPAMANTVLRELLPRFDRDYGGIRGVPGLRVGGSTRSVVLRDALSSARISVERADRGPIRLPSVREDEEPLWNQAPDDLTHGERQESEEWADPIGTADPQVRDVLLSRILRWPGLVNRTAEPHGFANCYTHHSGDLVIEWCCGDTVETLCANLLAHGFADGLPREKAIELISHHSAHLGDRTVILNRHDSCFYGREAKEIAQRIGKRYQS